MLTLNELLDNPLKMTPNAIAIYDQVNSKEYTFQDVKDNALRVTTALLQSDVRPHDRVVVISDNEPNFIFSDLGTLFLGATSVPINQQLKSEELSTYLDFIDPKAILAKGRYIEGINAADRLSTNGRVSKIICIEDALKLSPHDDIADVNEDDISTMLFSSGSSSDNDRAFKVIMLSHGNIASNINDTRHLLELVRGGNYLTGLAQQWHSFEYMVQKALLHYGVKLCYTNRKKFLSGEAASLNPDVMLMIPRVANKIMEDIKGSIRGDDMGKKASNIVPRMMKRYLASPLFNLLHQVSASYVLDSINHGRESRFGRIINSLTEKMFYSKIRKGLTKRFGNKRLFLVGGSAPLPLETAQFFFPLNRIYQGFGLTETSPVVSVNVPDAYRLGSSGKPIASQMVKIVDHESNEQMKEGDEGVILLKGPNIFKGYYKDAIATEKAFKDGWFDTGDIGKLADGYLYITGRAKRLICFSNGEKMCPEPIEGYYENKSPISRLICIGNDKMYPGALIVPDTGMLEGLKNGSIERSDALSIVERILIHDCKKRFKVHIKRLAFILDFDEEKYVTPTQKLRFNMLMRDYRQVIDRIYNNNGTR